MWLWLLACAVDGDPLPVLQQQSVELHILPFVDRSRPTPAFIDLPASDVRTLTTWVWLPAGAGEGLADRPVILMAHGNGGHPDKFTFVAEELAAHGAVVAAPVFPATNRDGDSAGLALPDLYEQPSDLAFVLAELQRESGTVGSVLHRRLDVSRTLAVGHSLGGATIAGWSRWGEADGADLRGTVLVAPAVFLNAPFGEGPYAEGPPVQIVHGADDELIPPSQSRTFADAVDEPMGLAVVPGVGHAAIIEGEGIGSYTTLRIVRGVYDSVMGVDEGGWIDALDLVASEGVEVTARGM